VVAPHCPLPRRSGARKKPKTKAGKGFAIEQECFALLMMLDMNGLLHYCITDIQAEESVGRQRIKRVTRIKSKAISKYPHSQAVNACRNYRRECQRRSNVYCQLSGLESIWFSMISSRIF
jgi:hypothetical protein